MRRMVSPNVASLPFWKSQIAHISLSQSRLSIGLRHTKSEWFFYGSVTDHPLL